MKKFSLSTAAVLLALTGLSVSGVQAAVDGAIELVSSDPNVLAVTQLENGLFRVDFVGVGKATLTASADADLTDGVRKIISTRDFEIIDQALEADHFDFQIMELIERAPIESAQTSDSAEIGTGAASDAASAEVDPAADPAQPA